jgi:hypothetical protein
MSRWLRSAATTPPDKSTNIVPILTGSQRPGWAHKRSGLWSCCLQQPPRVWPCGFPRWGAGIPIGCGGFLSLSGGVAPLNHRLRAEIPAGLMDAHSGQWAKSIGVGRMTLWGMTLLGWGDLDEPVPTENAPAAALSWGMLGCGGGHRRDASPVQSFRGGIALRFLGPRFS